MDRSNEVGGYALLHGVETASKHFNIKESSVRRFIRRAKEKKAPVKILELDIETAPLEVYVWSLKQKGYIDYRNIIKDWNLLCWSGKWLNGHKYIGDVLKPKESIKRNDERIVYSAWKALEKADVVIGHNVKWFDIGSLVSRFLYYNFKPTTPFQIIDTLTHSRKIARQTSHKLGYLNKLFKLPEKLKTDFQLWIDCLKGNPEALGNMYNYCEHDVGGLEELYLRLRPWMKSHPNLALYEDLQQEKCPACLSTKLEYKGSYATPMNLYDSFRCECGHIGRARKGVLTKFEKENLTRSVAR